MMFLALLMTIESPPTRNHLLELYTSEGCSSCPPADRWLSQLEVPGVIPLALHVDYWDSIGWPDPFAKRIFSERQQQHSREVYTPETLLDGEEFRDRANLKNYLKPETASVKIKVTVEGDHAHAVVDKKVKLILVAFENGLVVDVPRGENAGKKLRHDFVARAWAEGTGEVELAIPRPAHGVIAFAESKGKILQAVSVKLRE
jgi:hypothetical protein